ncbi:MAG: SRPBCC domain-containing protein [Alphaproteobacteria bacterium]|nr:SRPBCC domain-containing protein [Alphaproteobacteria bacterium]
MTTKEFMISHTFDVPRATMFKIWTDPQHLKHWWGPKGFKVRVADMDFKVGGNFHYCLLAPDGSDMWGKFVFRDIVPNERIIFISSFSDEKGSITRHPMSMDWPLKMLSTITFEENQGKTTVTVKWLPYEATDKEIQTFEEGRSSMQQGWSGTFEQLETYIDKI